MLPLFLGLTASAFLLLAKFGIARIILYKENYLFLTILIVFSQLLVVAIAFLTLSLLEDSIENFIYGFSIGLVTSLLFYVISHTIKKPDED